MIVNLFDSLYVLTLGKKRIVTFFSAITLLQLIVGVYMIGISANKPGRGGIVRLLRLLTISHLRCDAANTTSGLSPVRVRQVSPHRDGIHVNFTILR